MITNRLDVPHSYAASAERMVDADKPLTFTVMPSDCNPRRRRDEFHCGLATALTRLSGIKAAQVKRTRTYLLRDDNVVVRYATARVIQAAFDRDLIKVPSDGIVVTIKPVPPHALFGSTRYAKKLSRDRRRSKKARATPTTKKKRSYTVGDTLELSLRHGGAKCAFLAST